VAGGGVTGAPPRAVPRGDRSWWRRIVDGPFPFVIPFVLAFLLLVLYPIVDGFYLGFAPNNFTTLFGDPTYLQSVVNTVLFVVIGVNVKMFLALLLSGFFAIPRWWAKALLALFLLPWAVPAVPGFLTIHFMLNDQYGFINTVLGILGVSSPPAWLISSSWGFGAAVAAYIWKWLPFWTIILLAARTSIPREVYEAAAVDGATGIQRFLRITFPMLRNVYITSVLLSTIWTLGNYNAIYFITGGGPIDSTQVFATLGIKYAFQVGDVSQGVAVALTALPALIPLIVFLVRRLKAQR
jgi:multiple sugar transport system permease protein